MTTPADPAPRCRIDEDEIRAWLASTNSGDWMPVADRLGVDPTFKAGMPQIGMRAARLVSEAQAANVFRLPGHAIAVWQIGDEGTARAFLITVRLPNGAWLAMGDVGEQEMFGTGAGRNAAVHVLQTVAREVSEELRRQAERYPPHAAPTTGSPLHAPRGFPAGATLPAQPPSPPQAQLPGADRQAPHR